MSQFPPPAPPGPPAAMTPPTIPGDLPPLPAAWPKVLGIFSIVWGSLALVCNGCGVIGIVFQNFAMSMMPQQQNGQQMPPMPDVMKAHPVEMAVAAAGLAVGILLIIAGSVLVGRRPAARPLHLAYAVASLLLTAVGAIVQVQKQTAIAAWIKQNPDDQWAKMAGPGASFGVMIVFVSALIAVLYPLFVLVWFGLVKRDNRDLVPPPELVA